MSTTVTVAPREIHDLVYRASSVAGCDAGTAERIADNVTFAEIHHGAAVRAFCAALETETLGASAWATAPDVLAAAELAARSAGIASVTFDPPVPLAAIAGTLQQSLERGVTHVGADTGARDDTGGRGDTGARYDTGGRGDSVVSTIDLRLADESATAARQAQIDDARADAYRNGIAVEQAWFSKLEAAAADYLVAESILDEIDAAAGVA